jgi:hypothetical protein
MDAGIDVLLHMGLLNYSSRTALKLEKSNSQKRNFILWSMHHHREVPCVW